MSEEPSAWFLASIYLTAWTQVRHQCTQEITTGWQAHIYQAHSAGGWRARSQSPTAAHKIRSVKLFLPTAVAWAKQHIQTMPGHAFLEVNTGQGPFPIQPWLCIICFLEVKVYLWGPEKDSWLVEMWPHQPPHTFLWDKLSKEDLNTSCRYDCILAFSLVTRKLTSINRNSSNKL